METTVPFSLVISSCIVNDTKANQMFMYRENQLIATTVSSWSVLIKSVTIVASKKNQILAHPNHQKCTTLNHRKEVRNYSIPTEKPNTDLQ